MHHDTKIYFRWVLINVNSTNFDLMLIIDIYSNRFVFTVILISFSVFNFSADYIISDKFNNRFHLILLIFVISMVILIFSPRILSALIGWDGLGVRSFILVIYYFNTKSLNAGLITALVNRLGDRLLILRLVILIKYLDYSFFWYTKIWDNFYLVLLIIVARITKRAQIPFSAWLPAAMAAPTPVSSLVHSSTLVTAGVYLIIRHGELYFKIINVFLAFVGSITMLIARLSALREIDIKKIIALSTLRQLGIIVLALGVGNWLIRFIHLLTHAFFKALLFIRAGNIIHSNNRYQNMKMRGSTRLYMPLSYSSNIICRLRLAGIPFISAFFSKEPIIEIANERWVGNFIYWIIILGIRLTIIYSLRLVINISVLLSFGSALKHVRENFNNTNIGMIMLYPGALFGGKIIRKWCIFFRLFFFNTVFIKLTPIILLILGGYMGIKVRIKNFFIKYVILAFLRMWSLPWVTALVPNKIRKYNFNRYKLYENLWITETYKHFRFLNFNYSSIAGLSIKSYGKIIKLLVILLTLVIIW